MQVEAQAAVDPASRLTVTSFYSTPEGKSAARRLRLKTGPDALPVEAVFVGEFRKGDVEDWHVTPAKFLVMTSTGSYDIKVSDGSVETLGPGAIAYYEDLTGEGHRNEATADGSVVLMKLPDDFDIDAWTA